MFHAVSDPSKDFQLAVEVREKNGSQIQMQTTAVKSGNDLSLNTILASFAPESKWASLSADLTSSYISLCVMKTQYHWDNSDKLQATQTETHASLQWRKAHTN